MNPALTHIRDILIGLRAQVQEEIIGQDALIDKLIITIFAGGHALLEGVPGLGKTKTIRTLARVLALDTKRISFTPDLLPSDLTGNEIYRVKEGKFEIRKGPIFTGILLADEINRTPPKVQSALLEAMEEKKVTIGDKTLALPEPFIVFATQNPLEHEGTYPLPEAELDRFLMKIVLSYPSREDEKRIFMQETGLSLGSGGTKDLLEQGADSFTLLPSRSLALAKHGRSCAATENGLQFRNDKKKESLSPTDILEMIEYISLNIRVDEKIYEYVGDLLSSLRNLTQKDPKNPESFRLLSYGPSTRAGLALIRAGRIMALLQGRDYMLPDDIKTLAHDVLDHRIGLSYEAMSEGFTPHMITAKILESVKVA